MDIPTVAEVRQALAPLTIRQLARLSELSGVPAATIYKIRRGETANPGMDTVGQFAPHIAAALLATTPEPDRAAA